MKKAEPCGSALDWIHGRSGQGTMIAVVASRLTR